MSEQEKEKKDQKSASKPDTQKYQSIKIDLALACDQFVNGQDRLAGYVILTGACVGKVNAEDINRWLQSKQLKAVEVNKDELKEK